MNRILSMWSACCAILVLLGLGGCANKPATVNLHYKPYPAQSVGHDKAVTVVQLFDSRDGAQIASGRTGIDEKPKFKPNQNPSTFLTGALADQLEAAGYKVTIAKKAPDRGVVISGQVDKFSLNRWMTSVRMDAVIKLKLSVNGKTIAQPDVDDSYSEAEDFDVVILKGTQYMIGELVPQIVLALQ